jgi:hypothetical protein
MQGIPLARESNPTPPCVARKRRELCRASRLHGSPTPHRPASLANGASYAGHPASRCAVRRTLSCEAPGRSRPGAKQDGGGVTGSETIYICESRRFALISLGEMHVRQKRRKFDPHRPGGCNQNIHAISGRSFGKPKLVIDNATGEARLATRLARPPGSDSHRLEQRTFARRT